MIIGHGGNINALAQRIGCPENEIIDMSSNINPMGPPQGFEEYIKENIKRLRSLPEVDAMGMIRAFARAKNIDINRIASGNGTTWFIYTLIQAMNPGRVLILAPAYSDYKDACIMYNVPFTFFYSHEVDLFVHDLDKVSWLADKYDMVFICNPNNPSGGLIPGQDIVKLIKGRPDTLFVVDESYLPFVHKAEDLSLINDTELTNSVVLTSMSKIFGVPGLRTGFMTAAPEIITRVMHYYQPWSINCFAQAGISYLLDQEDQNSKFINKTRQFISRERKRFMAEFKGVRGIKLFFSETSFILAKLCLNIASGDFVNFIGDHKILIRDCSNFDGLSEKFVRFSLKTDKLNKKLIDLIKGALEELPGSISNRGH